MDNLDRGSYLGCGGNVGNVVSTEIADELIVNERQTVLSQNSGYAAKIIYVPSTFAWKWNKNTDGVTLQELNLEAHVPMTSLKRVLES
jgi:hypothetical protein